MEKPTIDCSNLNKEQLLEVVHGQYETYQPEFVDYNGITEAQEAILKEAKFKTRRRSNGLLRVNYVGNH